MRHLFGVLVVISFVWVIAGYHHGFADSPQQSAAPKPQPSATPRAQGNPNQEINDRFVKQFSEKIAGRENEPAEKVFKNIQWLKSTPAGRFLRIMNGGYSRALGVACTHCHV